jgi:hypothetical protein|tara:strand:+ start:406 stop:513 length:108 start_codon:yes stop_codon:yes gene_type:complete
MGKLKTMWKDMSKMGKIVVCIAAAIALVIIFNAVI